MPFSKTGILPARPGRFHETGKAGGMAEWSKAAVLKTVNRKVRGFESCSLRQNRKRLPSLLQKGAVGSPLS